MSCVSALEAGKVHSSSNDVLGFIETKVLCQYDMRSDPFHHRCQHGYGKKQESRSALRLKSNYSSVAGGADENNVYTRGRT